VDGCRQLLPAWALHAFEDLGVKVSKRFAGYVKERPQASFAAAQRSFWAAQLYFVLDYKLAAATDGRSLYLQVVAEYRLSSTVKPSAQVEGDRQEGLVTYGWYGLPLGTAYCQSFSARPWEYEDDKPEAQQVSA
jgi:hypothetical protein